MEARIIPVFDRLLKGDYFRHKMTKRLTIVIDEENLQNLYLKKAKGMVALNKKYSFSRVVNDVLRAGFREEEIEK